MKFMLTTVFLCTITLFYPQQKIMKGFGKLHLGMTVQEVNNLFDLNLQEQKNSKTLYGSNHDYIRITDDLVIQGVELTFLKNRLILISCDYNEQLHNGLSRIYGVESRISSSTGLLFKFKTNSSQTTSVSLYKNVITIFDNTIDYPLFFKKMNPALWELNKAEGFEGL